MDYLIKRLRIELAEAIAYSGGTRTQMAAGWRSRGKLLRKALFCLEEAEAALGMIEHYYTPRYSDHAAKKDDIFELLEPYYFKAVAERAARQNGKESAAE